MPPRCRTEPSVVINPANGQRLTYGEIAAFGTIPATLPAVDPKELKDRKDFRLIGKSVPRRDTPLKVNGTAQYAIDVKLPGMVYASTLHSPVHNAQAGIWDPGKQDQSAAAPASWNDAEIKAMKGVIGIVKLPTGLAVVADHFETAKAGRDALKVTWSKAKADGFSSDKALEDYVRIHADPNAQAAKLEEKGDVKAAFAGAAKTYHAEFRSDYGYHAQMEPLNAVVRISDAGDKAEVWEGSQAPDESRKAVAKALGLKDEQVDFHQCYMGGGFGRRSLGDYAAECALIAKEVRRPVKLIWTREEDIAQGMFRPQSFQCLEAATDASGKVTGWKHCVVGDGEFLLITGIKIPYYGVPNQHIERRGVSHGIKLKHWRAVGHVFNTFAIESFVDQMAVDQGIDPIEFRFERMGATPKARKVFEALAQMSDYKAKRPDGRAIGISITERSGSLGAGAVEISLDRATGKIRVHKVWAGDRRRRDRAAGRGQGQCGERDHLRPVQHPARARDHQGRRRGAVELPRLQRDAHVGPAGGDERQVRRGRHQAHRPGRDRQSLHRGRNLERALSADRQADTPPAVHARARARNAQGVSADGAVTNRPAPLQRKSGLPRLAQKP